MGADSAGELEVDIVLVLMDNLGCGELGVYGGGITRGAPTPRIDRLTSEGMYLTNFNVQREYTPSRVPESELPAQRAGPRGDRRRSRRRGGGTVKFC